MIFGYRNNWLAAWLFVSAAIALVFACKPEWATIRLWGKRRVPRRRFLVVKSEAVVVEGCTIHGAQDAGIIMMSGADVVITGAEIIVITPEEEET